MSSAETPPKGSIWAAGGVVHRHRDSGTEYLLVHRPRYDDWSLPKGKLNRGEPFLEAALREVSEETGIRPGAVLPIGSVGYDTPEGHPKVVRWWLMEATDGHFAPNGEVDLVEWLSGNAAEQRLTYVNDLHVLQRCRELVADPGSTRLYVVRHAAAGDRRDWSGPDERRPLDATGRGQAAALGARLIHEPITRVISSPHHRCAQTIAPLAKRLGLSIEYHEGLVEETPIQSQLTLIGELSAESAVLCSHGDVIANLVSWMMTTVEMTEPPATSAKGSVWIMRLNDGEVRAADYLSAS